jgi:hypothetical protein
MFNYENSSMSNDQIYKILIRVMQKRIFHARELGDETLLKSLHRDYDTACNLRLSMKDEEAIAILEGSLSTSGIKNKEAENE